MLACPSDQNFRVIRVAGVGSGQRRDVDLNGGVGHSIFGLHAIGGRRRRTCRGRPVEQGQCSGRCRGIRGVLEISVLRHQQAAIDHQTDEPAEDGKQNRQEYENLAVRRMARF